MHLLHPVAQAVGYHLHDAGMAQIDRVPGAGVVDVVALLVRQQAVVGGVVDALEGQGRAALIALRGVIVDHVQDDLEPGIVEPRHHLLELAQTVGGVGGVARVGREEADGVVPPVIGESLLDEMTVIDEGVYREQLDRGDAQRLHIVDRLTGAEAGICAPQLLRHLRMALGEALDVGLVDDGVVPGHGLAVGLAFPVEIGIDHHAFGHEGRAVPLVEGEVVHRLHLIAEDGGIPLEFAGMARGHRGRAAACWD